MLPIVFPDVEALAVKYLTHHLSGPSVSTADPDLEWLETNQSAVVLSAAGDGGDGQVLDEAVFGFTCYAPTTVDVQNLAAQCRAHMAAWPYRAGGVYGFRSVARPQHAPDESKNYPAYWFSCALRFAGTDLT